MAAKKKPVDSAMKSKSAVSVRISSESDKDDAVAKVFMKPEVTAALTIQQCNFGLSDVDALIRELAVQVGDVHGGSMKRAESMLIAQAHTLDALFNSLARKALGQTHMPNYESFMRMALRAQNQCRTTLETLSNIKNPPVIFAKQANISNGHQQVNNGTPAPATHSEEIKNQKNELLEHTDGERLDTRTKGEAISVNSELEAVG